MEKPNWSVMKTRKARKAPTPPPAPVHTMTKAERDAFLESRPDLQRIGFARVRERAPTKPPS